MTNPRCPEKSPRDCPLGAFADLAQHAFGEWGSWAPKSDTPPFEEHGCEGEVVCMRAVNVKRVACSAITVRVRPGSGLQRDCHAWL